MISKCEVEGCNKPARFGLYRFNKDGTKTWTEVCIRHEMEIGDENARRYNQEIGQEI